MQSQKRKRREMRMKMRKMCCFRGAEGEGIERREQFGHPQMKKRRCATAAAAAAGQKGKAAAKGNQREPHSGSCRGKRLTQRSEAEVRADIQTKRQRIQRRERKQKQKNKGMGRESDKFPKEAGKKDKDREQRGDRKTETNRRGKQRVAVCVHTRENRGTGSESETEKRERETYRKNALNVSQKTAVSVKGAKRSIDKEGREVRKRRRGGVVENGGRHEEKGKGTREARTLGALRPSVEETWRRITEEGNRHDAAFNYSQSSDTPATHITATHSISLNP